MFLQILSLFLYFPLSIESQSTYCTDATSCESESLSNEYIFCYGYKACESATVKATTGASCGGCYGCLDATVTSDDWVLCHGARGCQTATVEADDEIYCYGLASCYYSTISYTGGILYAYGRNSGLYSSISSTSDIMVYGDQSLYGADIDTDGIDTFNIHSGGYNSLFNAYLYCRNGTTCNIYCNNTGCADFYMYCYSGATCNLDCDPTCDTCPYTVKSTSYYDDMKFEKHRLQYKNDKNLLRLKAAKQAKQALAGIPNDEDEDSDMLPLVDSLSIINNVHHGNNNDKMETEYDIINKIKNGNYEDDHDDDMIFQVKDAIPIINKNSNHHLYDNNDNVIGWISFYILSLIATSLITIMIYNKCNNNGNNNGKHYKYQAIN